MLYKILKEVDSCLRQKNTDVAIATVSIFNDKYGLTNQNICGDFGINWY